MVHRARVGTDAQTRVRPKGGCGQTLENSGLVGGLELAAMGIEEAQTKCKHLGPPAVGNWGEIKPAAKAGHEWARGQMSSGRARWAWPWPVQGMGKRGIAEAVT